MAAVTVWGPSKMRASGSSGFHCTVHGAAVTGGPTRTPSTRNSTRLTPTSSVGFALRVTGVVTVAPAAGAVIEPDGGWVLSTTMSTGGAVVTGGRGQRHGAAGHPGAGGGGGELDPRLLGDAAVLVGHFELGSQPGRHGLVVGGVVDVPVVGRHGLVGGAQQQAVVGGGAVHPGLHRRGQPEGVVAGGLTGRHVPGGDRGGLRVPP